MRKKLILGIVFVLSLGISLTWAQQDRKETVQRRGEPGITPDSNQYVIGPEDVLYIHVWKEEALTKQLPVRMDGKLSLPLIDEVVAAGLTPLQLKESLTQKLRQFVANPVVSVVVMEANSFKVYVTGQVRTPGVHQLRGETTVLQLVSLVGGFVDLADPKKITIIRKEAGKEKRFVINYKKIVSGEDLGSNIILKSGDTIVVPMESPENVKMAILQEIPKGEVEADSNKYVIGSEDVLNIHVWREDSLSKTVTVRMDGKISLPLIDDVQAAGVTPIQLKETLTQRLKRFIDNPVVTVTVTEANSSRVYVSGQVRTPGVYRIRSETTILQLITLAGGFTDWANRKKVTIIRREDGKEKRIIVNYTRIVNGEDLSSNIILKPGDTVIVP